MSDAKLGVMIGLAWPYENYLREGLKRSLQLKLNAIWASFSVVLALL
jgi:hypothetical protein